MLFKYKQYMITTKFKQYRNMSSKNGTYLRTAPFLLLSAANSLVVAFQTFVKYITYTRMYLGQYFYFCINGFILHMCSTTLFTYYLIAFHVSTFTFTLLIAARYSTVWLRHNLFKHSHIGERWDCFLSGVLIPIMLHWTSLPVSLYVLSKNVCRLDI